MKEMNNILNIKNRVNIVKSIMKQELEKQEKELLNNSETSLEEKTQKNDNKNIDYSENLTKAHQNVKKDKIEKHVISKSKNDEKNINNVTKKLNQPNGKVNIKQPKKELNTQELKAKVNNTKLAKKGNKSHNNLSSNKTIGQKSKNIFLDDAFYILKNDVIPEQTSDKFIKDEALNIRKEKEKQYYLALNEAIVSLLNDKNESDLDKETYLINYSKHIITDIDFEFFENAIFSFVKKYIEVVKNKLGKKEFELICNTIVDELKISTKNPQDYIAILEGIFTNNTISTEKENYDEEPISSGIIVNVLNKNILPNNFSLNNYSANQKKEFYENIVFYLNNSLEKGDKRSFYNQLINFSEKLLPQISSTDSLYLFEYFLNYNKKNQDDVIVNTLTRMKNYYVKVLDEKDFIIFSNNIDKIFQTSQLKLQKSNNFIKKTNIQIEDKKNLVSNKILSYNLITTLAIGFLITGILYFVSN